MIIVDEQLLGHSLELEIAKWYKGQVQFIIDLRPALLKMTLFLTYLDSKSNLLLLLSTTLIFGER